MAAWIIGGILAAAAQVSAPAGAAAQNQVSPEHAPAALDALLAARDYMGLGARIRDVSRQPDLVSDLDWLKERTMEGNSAFVTMLYSRLLWSASAGLPPAPARSWRQTSAMMTLYAMAAMIVDGSRCGDRSAPANRSQQLLGWNREIWPFIRSLSEEERQTLIGLAILLEQRTAARRDATGDVDFLCRAGLEETSYNLTHGTAREVPTAPGQIGRQIELTGDGKYKPSERPEAEWRADGEKKRARLAADLSAFVGGLMAAAPPPPN